MTYSHFLISLRLTAFALVASSCWAQHEITIDWAGQPKALVNVPTRVDQPLPVKIRVRNVNDFLYGYEGKITYEPNQPEAMARVDRDSGASVAGENACEVVKRDIAAAAEAIGKDFTLKKAGDKYPSVPLADSKAAWAKLNVVHSRLEAATSAQAACAEYKTEYVAKLQSKLAKLKRVADGDHEFTFADVLPGDGKYCIDITERYDDGAAKSATNGGAFTACFYAQSSQFFLSVGYLATQVQNRSYDTVDVGKEGAATVKELRIQGLGSFQPAAAVMLNYKLPVQKLMDQKMGLALSAGPVFRTSASQVGSTASNWGIFGGVSIHLWERLWITPGLHIGEFSDMPLGFSNTASRRVPEGIANPITGVNRWTTRWGVGITFKAADFKRAIGLAADFKEKPAPPADKPTTQTAARASSGGTGNQQEPKADAAAIQKAEERLKAAKGAEAAAQTFLNGNPNDANLQHLLKLAVDESKAAQAALDKLKGN